MQRLKTRGQFQAVLAGDRVAATAHFALHRCPLSRSTTWRGQTPTSLDSRALLFAQADVWLGVMMPKRWAKRAVTRNTIKRQILNVSSEFESALPMAAYVVRLRSSLNRAKFSSATSAALKLAVRTELMLLFSDATQGLPASRSTDGAAR